MARYRRKRKHIRALLSVVILVIVALMGWLFGKDTLAGLFGPQETPTVVEGNAQFHFIDVGQGDAALIRLPEGNVLIDAGPGDAEEALKAYLDKEGITTIDYAVFTHPDEDHIGGADMVMTNYTVKNVILPDATKTTKTYTRMMDAIEASGATVIQAVPGKTFSVGGMKFTVLAPLNSGYVDVNNYSVVLKAVWGSTSAILAGDAEKASEEEMVSRYGLTGELDCDLLKISHHGSETSSTDAFLRATTPTYSVISVGEGNSYGHPTAEVLARLDSMGITYWRTDLEGSVVIVSNGETLTKK